MTSFFPYPLRPDCFLVRLLTCEHFQQLMVTRAGNVDQAWSTEQMSHLLGIGSAYRLWGHACTMGGRPQVRAFVHFLAWHPPAIEAAWNDTRARLPNTLPRATHDWPLGISPLHALTRRWDVVHPEIAHRVIEASTIIVHVEKYRAPTYRLLAKANPKLHEIETVVTGNASPPWTAHTKTMGSLSEVRVT